MIAVLHLTTEELAVLAKFADWALTHALLTPAEREAWSGIASDAARAQRLDLRKPAWRKPLLGKSLKQEKREKRAAHKQETAELRAVVMERAGGRCESCGAKQKTGLEMDHFLGGSGRRREEQSAENCWMLCGGWRLSCHAQRSANLPDVATWNQRFAAHCERYGYPLLRHIEHQRRGVARG